MIADQAEGDLLTAGSVSAGSHLSLETFEVLVAGLCLTVGHWVLLGNTQVLLNGMTDFYFRTKSIWAIGSRRQATARRRLTLLFTFSLAAHAVALPLVGSFLLLPRLDTDNRHVEGEFVRERLVAKSVPLEQAPPESILEPETDHPILEPPVPFASTRMNVDELEIEVEECRIVGPELPRRAEPDLTGFDLSIPEQVVPVSVRGGQGPKAGVRRINGQGSAGAGGGLEGAPAGVADPEDPDKPPAEVSGSADLQDRPVYPEVPPERLWEDLASGRYELSLPRPFLEEEDRRELVRRIERAKPRRESEWDVDGTVVVRFRLDDAGRPLDVHVVEHQEELSDLEEKALRMVREGGPYPVPTVRRALEFFVGVGCLLDGMGGPPRIRLVRSSGNPIVDEFALKTAEDDARRAAKPGWSIHSYRVNAVVDFVPTADGKREPRFVEFSGDARFKTLISKRLDDLLVPEDSSAYLRVPIRFKNDW